MAHWKRLTGTDGDQIDVNMDAVAYLQEFKDHTAIHFVSGLSAEGKAMIVGVREKPDTIHLANPLHAAQVAALTYGLVLPLPTNLGDKETLPSWSAARLQATSIGIFAILVTASVGGINFIGIRLLRTRRERP